MRWGAELFKVGGPFQVKGLSWRRPARGMRGDGRDPVVRDFRRWQQGQTGLPFVDAGMRELAGAVDGEGRCTNVRSRAVGSAASCLYAEFAWVRVRAVPRRAASLGRCARAAPAVVAAGGRETLAIRHPVPRLV